MHPLIFLSLIEMISSSNDSIEFEAEVKKKSGGLTKELISVAPPLAFL